MEHELGRGRLRKDRCCSRETVKKKPSTIKPSGPVFVFISFVLTFWTLDDQLSSSWADKIQPKKLHANFTPGRLKLSNHYIKGKTLDGRYVKPFSIYTWWDCLQPETLGLWLNTILLYPVNIGLMYLCEL